MSHESDPKLMGQEGALRAVESRIQEHDRFQRTFDYVAGGETYAALQDDKGAYEHWRKENVRVEVAGAQRRKGIMEEYERLTGTDEGLPNRITGRSNPEGVKTLAEADLRTEMENPSAAMLSISSQLEGSASKSGVVTVGREGSGKKFEVRSGTVTDATSLLAILDKQFTEDQERGRAEHQPYGQFALGIAHAAYSAGDRAVGDAAYDLVRKAGVPGIPKRIKERVEALHRRQ